MKNWSKTTCQTNPVTQFANRPFLRFLIFTDTAQLIPSLSHLIAWTQDIRFPITQEKLKVTFRVGFKLLELCTTAALSSLSPMGQKHYLFDIALKTPVGFCYVSSWHLSSIISTFSETKKQNTSSKQKTRKTHSKKLLPVKSVGLSPWQKNTYFLEYNQSCRLLWILCLLQPIWLPEKFLLLFSIGYLLLPLSVNQRATFKGIHLVFQ